MSAPAEAVAGAHAETGARAGAGEPSVARSLAPVLLSGAAGAYTLLGAYFALGKHDQFLTGFDLANFDQGLWLLANGMEPMITQHGRLFWGDHFTPTVAGLLVPLYALGAGPKTLLVIQTITLASVAPLLYALARSYGAGRWPAAVPGFLWLLSPVTLIANSQDFHHVPFVAPAIVGSILALKRDRIVVFAILGLLACGAKEDIPLIYLMLGIVVALEGRRRLGLAISGVAVGIFVFAVRVFVPHFSDSLDWFQKRFAGDRADTVAGVLKWMIVHPLAALGDLLTLQNFFVVAILLLTTGGLCFLAPRWMLLALPALAQNLLSAHEPQHRVDDHYVVPVALGFFVAAAVGVRRLPLPSPRGRLLAAGGITAAVLMFPAGVKHVYVFSGWESQRLYNSGGSDAREAIIAMIPETASVAASVRITPHLTHRPEIYALPQPFLPANYGTDWSRAELARRAAGVEYVVLDTIERPIELPKTPELLPPVLQRRGFRLIASEGSVRLYRKW